MDIFIETQCIAVHAEGQQLVVRVLLDTGGGEGAEQFSLSTFFLRAGTFCHLYQLPVLVRPSRTVHNEHEISFTVLGSFGINILSFLIADIFIIRHVFQVKS